MAWYRTGVPRRLAAAAGSAGTDGSAYSTPLDPFGKIEPSSLFASDRKDRNEDFAGQKYSAAAGVIVKRWGDQEGQQFEKAQKPSGLMGSDEVAAKTLYDSTAGTAGTDGTEEKPLTDDECCSWLNLTAPGWVKSGSTSGVSAGGREGCVYYWRIVDCNPSYWGCGMLTAAGTGGTGDGLHYTNEGMVFIAPTIPDKDTINCGRTVDTKIKVAVLTADGKKQLAAEYGSAGVSGFGMGPGDELYDEFGPEEVCEDTANITTVAEDCNFGCLAAKIGFVSEAMHVGHSQDLVALYGDPSEEYGWSLSGGGQLSKTIGTAVTYTAPPSNFNCEENATVTLRCNGEVVDQLRIYVSDYYLPAAARRGIKIAPGTCYFDGVSKYGWLGLLARLDAAGCDGVEYTIVSDRVDIGAGSTSCSEAEGVANHRMVTQKLSLPEGSPYNVWVDYRQLFEVHVGCCPPQLGGI